jgi:uncharacterized protein involved in outer membrane biogenesis
VDANAVAQIRANKIERTQRIEVAYNFSMRRLYVIIAIVAVLVVAGVLAVVLGNVDKYRPQVQAELQKKLDCPVTLGRLEMRFFPFSIRVEGLTIGEPPQFPSPQPFATAKDVRVHAGLISLIRGNPDIKELDLDQPQIELIRNPAGVWNFSIIGGANQNRNQSSEFNLDELKINNGQLAVTDELTKEPRSVYDHIDARLDGLGPGRPVSGQFSLKQGSSAVLTGTLSLHDNIVEAAVKTTGVNVADLLDLAKAYGVSAAQGVSGSGKLSLNLHVQGPLSQASEMTYSGVVDIPDATLSSKSLSQQLVIHAASVQIAPGGAVVAVKSLQAEGFLLTNVRATAKFSSGLVELSPVSTGIFGGQADGTVSVNTKARTPVCSVNMRLSGVDANALLGAVSSTKNTLYGSLSAQTNVSFAVASGAELARTLNGTLNFNLANGRLKNVNIMNELAQVGKFLGSAPAQAGSATALRQFSGTMNIVNGLATTNNLVVVLDAASLSASGSLNLVNQALDLHMSAVLSSGASQSAGKTPVGGFLGTALANNKGELVVPVLVTGTMDHPVFTPDVQAMAKRKLGNLLPGSSDPGKLLNGILGQGSTQPGQPQNPINSLLNQFGKKKKP